MHQCTIKGQKIGDGAPVRVMGVINCSPESFFKGSYRSGKDISQRAEEMIAQGADIIDIVNCVNIEFQALCKHHGAHCIN